MPQFEMEGALEPGYLALDAFAQGYIEAMFFTEQDEVQDTGFNELSQTALATIVSECELFQKHNEAALHVCYALDYGERQAGADFWFTRNGHGVGYWDREQLETVPEQRDTLTDAAHACGARTAYLNDDGATVEYTFG